MNLEDYLSHEINTAEYKCMIRKNHFDEYDLTFNYNEGSLTLNCTNKKDCFDMYNYLGELIGGVNGKND